MGKIKLESYEKNIFECDIEAAKLSILIKKLIEEIATNESEEKIIRLNYKSISDEVLIKIIKWLEHHYKNLPTEENLEEMEKIRQQMNDWEKNFLNIDDNYLLLKILISAKILEIIDLIEVGNLHLFNKINGTV